MARRRPTAAQARDKRSRKMAIGLAVLLVVVGVIQGPKLMKSLKPPTAPASAAQAGAPATGAASTDTSASVTAAKPTGTQLASVSLLAIKDPFHAQIQVAVAGGNAGGAAGTPKAAATPKVAATPAQSGTAAPAAAGPTGAVGFTLAPPNAALIKTNGHRQVVAVGDGFPTGQPLFKVVALGKKGVRIGVVGGSFTSGIPTLLLKKGHKIELANEADGSHYILQLVRLTTADPKPAQPSAATPAASAPATPAASTPASASATPPAATPSSG